MKNKADAATTAANIYPALDGIRERDARRRAVSPELLIICSFAGSKEITLMAALCDLTLADKSADSRLFRLAVSMYHAATKGQFQAAKKGRPDGA